jgi:hypothetical protein
LTIALNAANQDWQYLFSAIRSNTFVRQDWVRAHASARSPYELAEIFHVKLPQHSSLSEAKIQALEQLGRTDLFDRRQLAAITELYGLREGERPITPSQVAAVLAQDRQLAWNEDGVRTLSREVRDGTFLRRYYERRQRQEQILSNRRIHWLRNL